MTPDDSMIPEWMKKKRDQDELAEAKKEAANQRALAARFLIQDEAPKFWKQLLEKLKITSDALVILKLKGSFSPNGPHSVRIQVMRPGIFPNMTYTDLFMDMERIRATTLDASFYNLQFCVPSDGAVLVMDEHNGKLMNVDQTSDFVMQRMVDLVESR